MRAKHSAVIPHLPSKAGCPLFESWWCNSTIFWPAKCGVGELKWEASPNTLYFKPLQYCNPCFHDSHFGLYAWNHARVRGWDRGITAQRTKRGGLWWSGRTRERVTLISFLACTAHRTLWTATQYCTSYVHTGIRFPVYHFTWLSRDMQEVWHHAPVGKKWDVIEIVFLAYPIPSRLGGMWLRLYAFFWVCQSAYNPNHNPPSLDVIVWLYVHWHTQSHSADLHMIWHRNQHAATCGLIGLVPSYGHVTCEKHQHVPCVCLSIVDSIQGSLSYYLT